MRTIQYFFAAVATLAIAATISAVVKGSPDVGMHATGAILAIVGYNMAKLRRYIGVRTSKSHPPA